MRCRHRKHKGEVWLLVLNKAFARVRDEDDEIRAEYDREETPHCLLLPSFSESIKHFRVAIDGEMWPFEVDKRDLKDIKDYLNESVVVAGPEAIRAVGQRALRDLLVGLALSVVGIGVTVGTLAYAASSPEGGQYIITHGLIVCGLVMVGKGIYGFVRQSHLQKLAQEMEDEDDRR
jgi:hypothetical protein